MRRLRKIRRRGRAAMLVVLAAAGLLSGTMAFAASNTVPGTKAGDGSGAVSGYVVSEVKFNLNAANPSALDSVTFSVDSVPPVGSTMRVQLASGGSWYPCANTGANLTCATTSPQATVAGTSTLRVVIAQ